MIDPSVGRAHIAVDKKARSNPRRMRLRKAELVAPQCRQRVHTTREKGASNALPRRYGSSGLGVENPDLGRASVPIWPPLSQDCQHDPSALDEFGASDFELDPRFPHRSCEHGECREERIGGCSKPRFPFLWHRVIVGLAGAIASGDTRLQSRVTIDRNDSRRFYPHVLLPLRFRGLPRRPRTCQTG